MKINEYNQMMKYLTRPKESEYEQVAMAGSFIKGGKKVIDKLIKKGKVKKGEAPKTNLKKVRTRVQKDREALLELAKNEQIPVEQIDKLLSGEIAQVKRTAGRGVIKLDKDGNPYVTETFTAKIDPSTLSTEDLIEFRKTNRAGKGQFTNAEAIIARLENTIKETSPDDETYEYVTTTFPNFIKELKAKPELANNENVWNNLMSDLPENQRFVKYDDGTVDFQTKKTTHTFKLREDLDTDRTGPIAPDDDPNMFDDVFNKMYKEFEDSIPGEQPLTKKKRTLNAEGGVIGGGMIEGEDLGDRTGFARPSSSARTSKQVAPGIIERTYTSTKGKGTTKTYVAMVKSGGEEIKKTFNSLEEAKKGLEQLKIEYPPQYTTPTGGAEPATELQKKFIRRAAKEAGIDRPNFKEYPTRGYSTNNKKGQLISKSVSKALKRNPDAQTYSELFPLKTKKISRADQNKIKDIFPDADFKKGSYGFSFSEEPRKYDQARRLVVGKDFSTTDYGFNFGKSENWLLTQFDRADYEPIYKKGTYSGKSKIVGFIDPETGTKYYHANYDPELLKLDTNAKLITQHPDADDIIRISDVAREGKYKVPDTLNKLFAKYGKVAPSFNDMLNYVLDKEGYKTTNNLIEKHHTKLAKIAPSQAIQLLTKDKNLLAESHRQKIEAAKDVTEKNKLIKEADEVFKKQGIKLDLPTGEKLGIKEIPSAEKYVEDTRKYVERVLLKDVAEKGPAVLENIGQQPLKKITDDVTLDVIRGKKLASTPITDMARVALPTIPAIFGPTGVAGLTYALRPEDGYDLNRAEDRLTFELEAALAPATVKGTSKAASYLAGGNQPLRRGLERAINLGMRAAPALRVARALSPIGLLSLAGEAGYYTYQKAQEQQAAINAMTPHQRELYESQMAGEALMGEAEFADGGRVGFEKGGSSSDKKKTPLDKPTVQIDPNAPIDPAKRDTLKGAGILGAGIAAGKLGLFKLLGKSSKAVKAAKAAKVAPLTKVVAPLGKTMSEFPEWFPTLINRARKEGTQTPIYGDKQIKLTEAEYNKLSKDEAKDFYDSYMGRTDEYIQKLKAEGEPRYFKWEKTDEIIGYDYKLKDRPDLEITEYNGESVSVRFPNAYGQEVEMYYKSPKGTKDAHFQIDDSVPEVNWMGFQDEHHVDFYGETVNNLDEVYGGASDLEQYVLKTKKPRTTQGDEVVARADARWDSVQDTAEDLDEF